MARVFGENVVVSVRPYRFTKLSGIYGLFVDLWQFKEKMSAKSKLLFSVGTHKDGSKDLDLLGKTRIHFNKSDAKFLAKLLMGSMQNHISRLSCGALVIDLNSKNRIALKAHPSLPSGIPKGQK